MSFIFTFVCLGLLAVSNAQNKIPEYIHICHRSDPEVAKCIINSVETLKPHLRTGIPEVGVPSLEPLFIPNITILRGDGEGSSRFRAYLQNCNVYGASNFSVTKLKLNIEKSTFRVGIKIPALKMIGEYEVDARILVVPIKGHGRVTANITDCEGQAVLRAQILESNGIRQMRFTDFDFAIKVNDYNVHLEDLFNGDPVLGKAANEILHSNKKDFIEIALPFIEKKASEILLEIANSISKNFNYDEVFPE